MLRKLALALVVLVPSAALAEEAASTEAKPAIGKEVKGLSFGLPAGGGPTAGLTYFLDSKSAIRADVGLNIPVQPDFGFNLSVEGGYRMYMPNAGRLYPFLQPGAFIRSDAGKDFFDTAALTIALTGGIGAEYFFTERFSVSGQTGLALAFANEFDDIALTTGTSALFANFYW